MDPRIAQYIRDYSDKYTREALTQQLLDVGYTREAIDATWAAIEKEGRDDTAGQGFWGRFFLILVGINVAVIVLIGLGTGAFFAPERLGLLVIAAVALTIGALIAWGIVALVGPTRMGRTTAMVIGVAIPLVFALLIGGSCYALLASLGPPPSSGTLTLQVDPPLSLDATGPARCQASAQGDHYTVYTESAMDSSQGPVSVYVNAYPEGVGGQLIPTVNITLGDPERPDERFVDYQPGSSPSAGIELEPGSTAMSGSLTFEGFLPGEAFDEQGQPIDRFDADPISGTISWSCES